MEMNLRLLKEMQRQTFYLISKMQSFSLDVVEIRQTRFFRVIKLLSILSIIHIAILFVLTLIDYNKQGDLSIYYLIWVASLAILLLTSFVVRNFIKIGEIKIEEKKVYIYLGAETIVIERLNSLKVEIDGYRGQLKANGTTFSVFNGVDNYLSFSYKDRAWKLRFYLKNKQEYRKAIAFFG